VMHDPIHDETVRKGEKFDFTVKLLVDSLDHCIRVLREYERKPGEDLKGFMLGALDNAVMTRDQVNYILDRLK
jgi:hypothetical protein